MDMMQLMIVGGGASLVLLLGIIAFAGPSPATHGARRLQAVRFRHSDSTNDRVEMGNAKRRNGNTASFNCRLVSVKVKPAKLASNDTAISTCASGRNQSCAVAELATCAAPAEVSTAAAVNPAVTRWPRQSSQRMERTGCITWFEYRNDRARLQGFTAASPPPMRSRNNSFNGSVVVAITCRPACEK